MKNKPTFLRYGFYVSVVLSFLITLTALWLNRTFYSPDTLADITTEVLQEESSRNAISNVIVDRVFEDRPVLAATAGPRLVPVISGLLDSDIAANSINTTVENLRVAFTADTPKEISINLTPLKSTIVSVQTVVGQSDDEKRINADNIPDEIVLLDTANFPNYSDEGIAVLWVGPIAFTFLVVSIGVWLYRGKKSVLYIRLRIIATLGIIASFIALLVGPLTQPIVVQYAKKAESQTIVGDLYEAMLASFNQQAVVLLALSVISFIAAILIPKIIKAKKSS